MPKSHELAHIDKLSHNANQDWKHHDDKEQGKTQHETSRSKNHKATHNKNHTRIMALERSVA